MAQYWEDWSGSTIGAAPTGWTARWDSGATYTVESDAEGPAGRRLKINKSTVNRHALSCNAIDADAGRATLKIRALVRAPATASVASTFLGVFGRGSGTGSSETGYTASLMQTGASAATRTVSSTRYLSATPLEDQGAPLAWVVGDFYWLGLEISGSTIRRTLATRDDPSTLVFDDSWTNADISAAGWAGLFSFTANSAPYYVYAVGVGTNGDEAPTSDLSRALQGAATVSASASADLTAAGAPAALAGDAPVAVAAIGDLTTSALPITVVTDVDAGNIDPTTVAIANASSSSPTVTVAHRSAAGSWRHFLFAVEGAQGKTPTFRMTLAGRAFSSVPFTADYRPVWTQDFVTWTRAPSRTVGGTYLEWQFTDPLPPGRVYIANMPIGRQADAVTFSGYLLASHASVATPTGSADAGGVYNTSPAETDDLGRAVGANPQYAIRLQWGGATTDGKRKRELVMIAGIHSAGEAHSWPAFVACVEWMLSDVSQAAQDFRANWNVRLYFNVTPNGLRGGSARVNFRSATDPNRTWVLSGASTLSEITALRSAIEADTGGRCDVFWSWHGAANTATPINVYLKPSDYSAGTRRPIAQALIDTITTLSGNTPRLVDVDTETSGNYTTTDMWWGEAKLGAALFGDVELQARGDSSHAEAVRVGEVWARTLQSLDAQGLFLPPIELAGASLVATTATGSLTTGIALAGAAGVSVDADASLTTAEKPPIELEGDAQASVDAGADLTVGAGLQGNAGVSVSAQASMTGGTEVSSNLHPLIRVPRYSVRLGGQMVYADSPLALKAAIEDFERQTQERAKKKAAAVAQEAPQTAPKAVARRAPRAAAVEAPDADLAALRAFIAETNERIRQAYEMEARTALLARQIAIEIELRQQDDEEALIALEIG